MCSTRAGVYKNYRQFETVSELKTAVLEVSESITSDYIFKLYRIIPKLFLAVIYLKEAVTKY